MSSQISRPPLHNPLEGLIGFQLHRAARHAMQELARRFAQLGTTTTSASILILVEANPGISQIELCRFIGLHRANMTPMVQALARRGLITKTASQRRRQALNLTRKGTTLAGRLHGAMDAIEALVYAPLPTPSARRNFLAALTGVAHQFPTVLRGRPLFRARRRLTERRAAPVGQRAVV